MKNLLLLMIIVLIKTQYLVGEGSAYVFGTGKNTVYQTLTRNPLWNSSINAKLFAMGEAFSIMLTQTGELYSTGKNTQGQLGMGLPSTTVLQVWTQWTNNYPFKNIVAGQSHIIAYNNTNFWTWGNGAYGVLGLGTTTDSFLPVLNPNKLGNPIKACAGERSTILVVNQNGISKIYAWGSYTPTTSNNPVFIMDGIDCMCGRYTNFYLSTNSSLYVIGSNQYGVFGIGNTIDQTTFTFSISNVVKVFGSIQSVFVKLKNNTIMACGKNVFGMLGIGSTEDRTTNYRLITGFDGNVTRVQSGAYGTVMLLSNGSTYSAGQGAYSGLPGYSSFHNLTYIGDFSFFQVINAGTIVGGTMYIPIQFTCNGLIPLSDDVCNGNGECVAQDTCVCKTGSPPDCGILQTCFNILSNDTLNVCSGKGRCIGMNQCECKIGFTGSDCSLNACYDISFNSSLVCSSRGSCIGPNRCLCNPRFSGNNCQYVIPSNVFCNSINANDPIVCGGNGACISNDTCVCSQKTFGKFCQFYNYYWSSSNTNGKWSETGNWKVETDSILSSVIRPPKYGDNIFLYQIGTFNIYLENNDNFTNIYVGSKNPQTIYNIYLSKRHTFYGDFFLNEKSNLIFPDEPNCNYQFLGNVQIVTMIIKPTHSMTFLSPSFIVKDLVNSGTLSIGQTNLNILLQASIINNENGFINLTGSIQGNSMILNYGVLNLTSNNSTTFLSDDININNFGTFHVNGNASISKFDSNPYSTFSIVNANISIRTPLIINDGSFFASGFIQTPSINITSNTGIIKFYSEKLTIDGSFYLGRNSTLIFNLDQKFNEKLRVTQNTSLDCLIYLKLGSFSIELGDVFQFLIFNNLDSYNSKIMMIGSAYKTAKLRILGNIIFLDIILSIGNLEFFDIYSCTYLGNQKTLEIVKFKDNNKVSLTLTTTPTKGWIGFGFMNENQTITNASSMVYFKNNLYQLDQHFNLTMNYSSFIDLGNYFSQSLFSIGKYYQSLSMFFESSLIQNQKSFFVAESNDPSNFSKHSLITKYDFNLMNGPFIPCTQFSIPHRVETRSPISISFILAIYLLLILISSLCFKLQPMYSRGLSPHITLLILLFELGLDTRNHDYILAEQRSTCLLNAYLIYPFYQLIYFFILFYFIRYFSIIHLNTLKNTIVTETGEIKFSFRIKLLKWTNHPLVLLTMTFAYYLFSVIINTIILAGSNSMFYCDFNSITNLKIFFNIIMILLFIIILSILIIDILLNIKELFKCNIKYYFFEKDPYLYRLQMYLFIPYVIFTIIFELVFIVSLKNIVDFVKLEKVYEIFNTISFTILVIIIVIFPLFASFIKVISNCFKIDQKEDIILKTLHDPKGYELFLNFSKKEYAIENVYAWKDIDEFKKKFKEIKGNEKEKYDDLATILATNIYKKYFNGTSSLYETNVPKTHCKDVYERIKNKDIKEDLYDKLYQEIIINLSDTYARLLSNNEYKIYQKSLQVKNELLDIPVEDQSIIKKAINHVRKSRQSLNRKSLTNAFQSTNEGNLKDERKSVGNGRRSIEKESKVDSTEELENVKREKLEKLKNIKVENENTNQ